MDSVPWEKWIVSVDPTTNRTIGMMPEIAEIVIAIPDQVAQNAVISRLFLLE
jgi:hypothetical protein